MLRMLFRVFAMGLTEQHLYVMKEAQLSPKNSNMMKKIIVLLIASFAMLAMSCYASDSEPIAEAAAAVMKSPFCGTFWALAPALFAIVLALVTKEVYSSLFAGVVLGACFVCDFSALDTVDFVVNQGLITALKDTSGVFISWWC